MPFVNTIPNKILKCPDSAGVLRVNLIRAANLINKDGFGFGKSDPYVIMTVGAHTHRVPAINNTLNPHWDLTYDFPIEVVQGQELLLEFYDEDDRSDDEFLGRARIQTSVVAHRCFIEGYWVDLVDTESGKVQVTLSWLPVIADSSLVKAAAKKTNPNDDSTKGLVHIYIDSCIGLLNRKDPAYKPSPMVRLISNHEKSQQSWPKYFTNDPTFEQGFVVLIKCPYTDIIRLDIIDMASKKDDVIGTCTIRIWSLIEQPEMEYPLQPWLLKGNSPDAKIVMSASLRGLLPPQCSPKKTQRPSDALESSSDSFAAPTSGLSDLTYDDKVLPGRIRLLIHKAEELEKKDVGGKSDPYVVASYETQRVETPVCKKTINPVWDHEIWLDIAENGDNQITIELFDKDKIGKDEKMGRTTIDVRRVSKQRKLSQMWDTLIGCKSGKIFWSAEFMQDKIESLDTPNKESLIVTSSFLEGKDKYDNDIRQNLSKVDKTIPSPDSGFDLSSITNGKITPDEVRAPSIPEETSYFEKTTCAQYKNENPERKTEAFEKLVPDNHGKIRLHILYDESQEELKVFIHEAANLPGSKLADPPDPYVKICLMPGKKKKRKTAVIKDNVYPKFNEEFDLKIASNDLQKYTLKVAILNKKGIFSKSSTLGRVNIKLDNPGVRHGLADWFPLEDAEEDSD